MLAPLVVACDVDMHEREICTYTVQLRYEYNEENTARENKITAWVDGIDEYIFEAESHLLYSIRHVTEELCKENLDSEMQLPAGKYSVIAVGNGDDRSRVYDEKTGTAPQIGKTHREDMRLSLDNPTAVADGAVGPCEELFHGYRTFTVREVGASRVRVDMMNAHFQLRFRVTWRRSRADLDDGIYYAVLEDIPSEYRMMPEWIFPAGSFTAQKHEPTGHDLYPYEDRDVIHHIPHTSFQQKNILSHSNETYLNADREIWGQFVNYRVKNDTGMMMNVYYASSGTRAEGDPMVLPKKINLKDYFAHYKYNLDHELKQEYALDIVVDGQTIIITPMNGLKVSDWGEGGRLN